MNKKKHSSLSIPQFKYPFLTCISCTAVPFFRLYITNNKLHIMIQCNCPYTNKPHIYKYTDFNKHITSMRKKSYTCTKHSNEKGIIYCANCLKWMCKKCFELHSKTTKNHILSDNEVTIQLNCSKHSKDNVVYYCGDCKSAFCEKCKKVHNKRNIIKSRTKEKIPS